MPTRKASHPKGLVLPLLHTNSNGIRSIAPKAVFARQKRRLIERVKRMSPRRISKKYDEESISPEENAILLAIRMSGSAKAADSYLLSAMSSKQTWQAFVDEAWAQHKFQREAVKRGIIVEDSAIFLYTRPRLITSSSKE